MNNVASPTVSGPTLNLQGLNPTWTIDIPKVSCMADATRYPSKPNSEDVLLDSKDPDIAYFRKVDANGFVQVDRRRCIAEPEPTQEELNDQRYLSRKEFSDFMDQFKEFREEMSENVRALSAVTVANANKSTGSYKPYNKQQRNDSANANGQNSNASS